MCGMLNIALDAGSEVTVCDPTGIIERARGSVKRVVEQAIGERCDILRKSSGLAR